MTCSLKQINEASELADNLGDNVELFLTEEQYQDVLRIDRVYAKYWYLPGFVRFWLFKRGACRE